MQRTDSSQRKQKKTKTTTLEKKNKIGTWTLGDITVITKLQWSEQCGISMKMDKEVSVTEDRVQK